MIRLLCCFLLFLSCNRTSLNVKESLVPCSQNEAQAIANEFVKQKKTSLEAYSVLLEENDSIYIFHYNLKDERQRGGGALIHISKNNCELVVSKLFQ